MSAETEIFNSSEYKYGFVSNVESETFPKGLNEDVIKAISKKKMNPILCWSFASKPTVNG